MAKKSDRTAPTPSRDDIARFISESPIPVTKREIARAFNLRGDDRVWLKSVLKEMEHAGAVERGRNKKLAPPAALPSVTVVTAREADSDGDLTAIPANWDDADGQPPRIIVTEPARLVDQVGFGDRLLVRLNRQADDSYQAKVIRRLGAGPVSMVGIVEHSPQGLRLRSADKRERKDYGLDSSARDVAPGTLVLAEVMPQSRTGGRRARVLETLGDGTDPSTISLIAIHAHGLPHRFSEDALDEARAAKVPTLRNREDLAGIPLVTIDGADARDFDDAVWAEPDPSPGNPGGWHLIVAIADVAHYVRPGSALDRDAFERGNSAYFPDRVVPMLPEALSNGLCSLNPGEKRGCLAVHMWITRDGKLRKHKFVRGIMRSAARLTYEQVQQAADGHADDTTRPLLDDVISPLYGAYRALAAARENRGTLELDLPERQIVIGEDGRIASIHARTRLDSHRLIEEFMITANVAAAQALESANAPCLYRVHDRPDEEKLSAARDFLHDLGYTVPVGHKVTPASFTALLTRASERSEGPLISDVILRTQAQAMYSPDNIGHFGLALERYAHFTSPIRRYADLVVHRSLIRILKLGPGALTPSEAERLPSIGEHISMTERRAERAERDSIDRYTAAFLSDRVGATFEGRISGVTGFGLFVRLNETGADGLVPISSLPDDFYVHEEEQRALVGQRYGRVYRLSAPVSVRLREADPLSGSTVFELLDREGAEADGVQDRLSSSPGARTSRKSAARAARGAKAAKRGTGRHKGKGRGKSKAKGRTGAH